jgi:hypothetical protein
MFALIAALHAQEAPPVIGGEVTEEYPGVVYLQMGGASGYAAGSCSGTLIADQWVLTAAHCLIGDYMTAYVGPTAATWEQRIDADGWWANPDYDGYTGYNDVALVHLVTKFQGVSPIALSQQAITDADLGTAFRVVGFGLEGDEGDALSGRKKYADISLEFYNEALFMVYDEAEEDAVCFGDSGGPVLRMFSDGSYAVAGVINFGPTPPDSCQGNAGANARVDYFLSWIDLYLTDYTVKGEATEGAPQWEEDWAYDGGVYSPPHTWENLEPVEAPAEDGLLSCSSAGAGAMGAMASVLAAFAARRRQTR